jgi:hypothetical protein
MRIGLEMKCRGVTSDAKLFTSKTLTVMIKYYKKPKKEQE